MTLTIINQKKIGSYDSGTYISGGSYGDVYVVEDESGKRMAVKIIDPKKLSYVELDILTRLRSPYIIRSVGDPVVEIQHAQGITLQLKDNCISKLNTRKLPYYQLKKIMLCFLSGLKCMHSKGFIHNDLVLRNLLYDKDTENGGYIGYIADFSVSIKCLDTHKGVQVTSIVRGSHTPVEILEGIKKRKKSFVYNDKTDIWALGLCFLEMIDNRRLHFSSDSEQLDFYHSIDQDFIKSKVKLYTRSSKTMGDMKISMKEELYLIELLTHMLKLNQSDRMGTDDIMYLNFVKTSTIKHDCSLNKPSELMALPVVSKEFKKGLKNIREYFDKNSSVRLSSYFLTLQIYTRIMNKVILDKEDIDLSEIVEISIKTAMNYYDRSVNAGYEAGIILNGEVGYNPYFYGAVYIEELKLVDLYLDEDAFVSVFNLTNPHDLFYQFRTMYDYGGENKITNRISYSDFKEIQMPTRKNGVIKIYLPSDYSNIEDGKITESGLVKEKKIEEIFNGMLIDYLKREVKNKFNKDFPDIYQLAVDYIEGGTRIRKKDIYKNIRTGDIFTTLMGINEYFEYGFIKIEMENIDKNVYHDRKFVVVSNNDRTSLLHIDQEDKVVTHYYSEPNSIIKNFYEENGYDYKVNFDYGINNCCKVVDSCVLFIIFNNNYDKENLDFEMKCISEETNFVIFLSLFLVQS